MGKRRTGLHPLAYMGVEPSSPPLLVRKPQAPNSNNNENFNIGTIWINNTTDNIWMLTNLDGGVATWTPLNVTDLTVNADTGSAVADNSELDLLGSNVVGTSATGKTITAELSNGGNGQLIIGGGSDPIWADLTSTGGSVTITQATNSINLEAAGVAALTSLEGDTGAATPAAGVITVAGGSNITTVAAVNTVTINLDNDVSVSGSLAAGTTVSAGTSIDSGTTITAGSSVASTTTMTCGTGLTVSAGGIDSTGTTQLQDLTEGVVFSSATGVLSIDGAGSVGTDGQVIIGATGSDPIWANVTSVGGSITVSNGANTINLESALTDLPWTVITVISTQIVVNNGYIDKHAAVNTNFILPATAVIGDRFRLTPGFAPGSSGFRVSQNAGQWITQGSSITTTGVAGYISAHTPLEFLCITANTGFIILSAPSLNYLFF